MKRYKLLLSLIPLLLVTGCNTNDNSTSIPDWDSLSNDEGNPTIDPNPSEDPEDEAGDEAGDEDDNYIDANYENILNDGNWNSRKNIKKNNMVTVDKSIVRDKVLGALVGNTIGLGSGFEYVHDTVHDLECVTPEGTRTRAALGDQYFEAQGYLLTGTLGVNNDKSNCYILPPKTNLCDPRVGEGYVVSDDDMHVDIMFQYLLREKGPFLDAYDVMEAWSSAGYSVHDAGGGGNTRDNADDYGFIVPYLGQQLYGNTGWYITEPWIENDMLGLDFPYMPRSCDTLASFTGSASGDGYSIHLGRLLAIMTSLSYEYDDAKVVMEKTFDYFDKNNKLYEMYQFVKSEYEKNTPWRETCIKICDKRIWTNNRPTDGSLYPTMPAGGFSADFSITANAGMIFLGLFYGENDFVNTIKITSLAGLDGDCTAASVGQIIGTIVGFDNIDPRYQNFLNGNSIYYNYSASTANKEEWTPGWDGAFAFCDKKIPYKTSFNQIADIILGNIEDQIRAFGGSVEESTYKIAKQELPTTKYVDVPNFSFEEGSTNGWECEGATLIADDASGNFRTKDVRTGGKMTGFGKAYQNVKLIPGHEYKASIYVDRKCDKEFRLFANDKYMSYIRTKEYVTNGLYYRHELTFVADKEDYQVGVELINSLVGSSNIIYFDDLEITDITDYVEPYSQIYNINYFYGNSGTSNVNNNALLTSNSSLKFEFVGYEGLQNFRFFISNVSDSLETIDIYIDNEYRGKLPVQVNGDGIDFNKGNYKRV